MVWILKRDIFKVPYVLRAELKEISQKTKKLNFNSILSFTFLGVLLLER